METIHVFFAFNEAYAMHACAAIASILKNSVSFFSFHILHKDISPASQEKIKSLRNIRPFEVDFAKVDAGKFKDIAIKSGHISIETTFRFLIPEIAPHLEKAIYLDCDLIVRDDLKKLWDTALGDCYAGVVEDFLVNKSPERKALFTAPRYFNAGVLLLNLRRMRRDFSLDSFLKAENDNRAAFLYQDQDVFNLLFGGNVLYLPLRWNATAALFRKTPRTPFRSPQDIAEARQNPAIVHFTGPDKPWIIPRGIAAHPFAPEYFAYLARTPFAEREKIIRAGFSPVARFLWFWWRHPGFFLRPDFWKMRALGRKAGLTHSDVSDNDARPRCVVINQYGAIGDFVWMLPYVRRIAERSRGGRVTIVSTSRAAAELVGGAAFVEEVIHFDRPKKRIPGQEAPRHTGLLGLFRLGRELRARHFDRAYNFGGRPNLTLPCFLAGIPWRAGSGFNPLQRPLLTVTARVRRPVGPGAKVYKETTALAIALGLCDGPLVPRLEVPAGMVAQAVAKWERLPVPLYVLGIGGSGKFKQWSAANYTRLAQALLEHGLGVLILAGKQEREMAREMLAALPENLRAGADAFTDGTLLESAAALCAANAFVGNDTGVLQMAAACEKPAWCVLGNGRPLLLHDPLVRCINSRPLHEITAEFVLKTLLEDGAPGLRVLIPSTRWQTNPPATGSCAIPSST